jgi:hypothetical protein
VTSIRPFDADIRKEEQRPSKLKQQLTFIRSNAGTLKRGVFEFHFSATAKQGSALSNEERRHYANLNKNSLIGAMAIGTTVPVMAAGIYFNAPGVHVGVGTGHPYYRHYGYYGYHPYYRHGWYRYHHYGYGYR